MSTMTEQTHNNTRCQGEVPYSRNGTESYEWILPAKLIIHKNRQYGCGVLRFITSRSAVRAYLAHRREEEKKSRSRASSQQCSCVFVRLCAKPYAVGSLLRFFLLLLVCKPTHSQPIRITGSVVGNTHSAVYISHATNSCLDMHRQQNRAVCVT